jgi:tRNA isopentenyl-2-thiomethyl-A-37 hydroxylase MiaE
MRLGDAKNTPRCVADKQLDGIRFHARLCEKFERLSKSLPREEIMPTFEAQLRQDLRNYAVELRQLAYTLPNGVGEHDLLRLSGRMHATADQVERQRSVDDG